MRAAAWLTVGILLILVACAYGVAVATSSIG